MQQKGITVILVLVFAAVFGLSVSALMSFIFSQAQLGASKVVREQALGIAEAGLEYYHWFLTVYPEDLDNGTGVSGPYVHTYSDPQDGEIGSFSLSVEGNMACGQVQSIDVTSTGTDNSDSRFTRTVFGRHAKPSVAEYSYIIGDDVWASSDREITGPYHSNGGIRMDGTNNSLVTSGVSTWQKSFNCDGGGASEGVCGDGPNDVLWQYPVSTISFSDMAADFSNLKTYAQADGIYLEPYGLTQTEYLGYDVAVDGYHLIFNSDGTVDIYEVTDTSWYWGFYFGTQDWLPAYYIIDAETFVERRTIPTDCPVIFVEDKVWIEGTVKGKVTLVAADLVNEGYNPDVILQDDLTYSTLNGNDGLTVLSEGGIYIPPESPEDLLLRGIFVAQGVSFERPYYDTEADPVKEQLTIVGSVVSKERVGTSWGDEVQTVSGYENRDNHYDRLQMTNPPPFTPSTTTTPRYILWQEL